VTIKWGRRKKVFYISEVGGGGKGFVERETRGENPGSRMDTNSLWGVGT